MKLRNTEINDREKIPDEFDGWIWSYLSDTVVQICIGEFG